MLRGKAVGASYSRAWYFFLLYTLPSGALPSYKLDLICLRGMLDPLYRFTKVRSQKSEVILIEFKTSTLKVISAYYLTSSVTNYL
ncbi:MAG: hypothetical protein F6K17_11710 [Okeania sp. SIO3C4]|nr:hypothetical protein [Okeania sp. SIO3C4]